MKKYLSFVFVIITIGYVAMISEVVYLISEYGLTWLTTFLILYVLAALVLYLKLINILKKHWYGTGETTNGDKVNSQ